MELHKLQSLITVISCRTPVTRKLTKVSPGENQIVIVPGANNCLSRSDVTAASDVLSAVKVVICQLETDPNLVLHSAEVVKRGGNGISFAIILSALIIQIN